MPQKNKKRKIIELIEYDTVVAVSFSNKQKVINRLIDDSIDLTENVLAKRYLRTRNYVPKSLCWYESVLPAYGEVRFRKNLRATREQFNYLLSLINTDPVFISTRKPQMDVFKQLAITLYKFGHSGTGASYTEVGSKFGIGDGGSIILIMTRVIKAILNLKKKFIFWPNRIERKSLSQTLRNFLPGCVGFVDGTHVNLKDKPSLCPEDYFSRKQRYGLHLQATCDVDKRIRHYIVGRTASAHDARVFSECSLGLNPDAYHSEGEWIAGDAAYKLTKYVITPFRKNSVKGTQKTRRKFNRVFSSYRIKIEHTFGVLFEKFPSLKELGIRISDAQTHRYACEWIEACCILYNIFYSNDDVDYFNINSRNKWNDDDDIYDDTFPDIDFEEDGQQKRKQLMTFVTS